VVERLTKRIALVDDDAVADTLTAELKEGVQERKRVEARVAELESYTTALREQQTEVERLRQIWGGWAGCLSSDPEYIPRARQVLKKTLGGVPICVRPLTGINKQDRRWAFAGISGYDAVLAGGLTITREEDGYFIEHRPTRTLAEALRWYVEASGYLPPTPAPGGTSWSLGTTGDIIVEVEPRPVMAGGSDADVLEDVHGGRPISGPPQSIKSRS
jgi:hypothetical protein